MTRWKTLLLLAPLWLVACGGPADERINGVLLPDIESAHFLMGVRHTHMHLEPKNTWTYERQTAAGVEITAAEVLEEQRSFPGVDAMTVKTTVKLGDATLRESTDWFAQDNDGAVWQLGREECQYEGASCVDTGLSWDWGGGDERPGIVLPARPDPAAGPFYLAFHDDVIEDVGEVVSTSEIVSVPDAEYNDCVQIHRTSKLDEGVSFMKYYCQIVGLTLIVDGGEKTELTQFSGI